jgi:protein involved in polysaccharide export with SLBB domain
MQIDELVKSYTDLLPEPASRAEIVRLVPPDNHPVTMEFNLDEVVDKTDPIELKPFDTVRIYGRYETDAPKVTVQGEVLRPGQYPLTKGMTATDLLRTAGGFKRSAYKQEAELGSYVVQNGEKILLDRRTVELSKALGGDREADPELKPGDELMVRNLSGWNEIGASVTLAGEVVYPGKYAIHDGERLSSVIKRAGGFRPESYPQGALLSRLEVQQFERRNREELIHRIDAASVGANAANPTASSQQRQIVTNLRSLPVTGRVVIRISSDIDHWQNTPDDIALRSGDSLTIPKRPGYVVVTGQVFNAAAITFSPGKSAGWYLKQAGGPNEFADKKAIFIVATNGSVIGESGNSFFRGDVLSTKLHPGDSIVVPEKIVGNGRAWKEILNAAQIASSIAITARVATSF